MELNLGLPCEWQEPKFFRQHLLPSRVHTDGKLGLGAGWGHKHSHSDMKCEQGKQHLYHFTMSAHTVIIILSYEEQQVGDGDSDSEFALGYSQDVAEAISCKGSIRAEGVFPPAPSMWLLGRTP